MKKSKIKSKTKFENNWLSKSLESLEKEFWGDIPKDEGYLVTTCHQLRKKQLKEFNTEDLRIMIGQNIGLRFLIPLALKALNKNILAEGHLYEGDLLKMVLTSDPEYWKIEIDNWTEMCNLFRSRITEIEKEATEYDTGRKILKAYKEFEKIN
ncbi:contact-dependent growth inhibition system immunity protein [Winogradskyella pulchriflava]|uniref:Contact-dependent growth inhibition system immunity protein n=1 Tax=Winogradskyella pulchriflava TaxID=1110688 RepID=A0ABV6QC08_9FLAO